jgi:hypothetical protein
MRVKTRFKNLRKFGVDEERARMWAKARKGYWRIAKSPILATVITNRRLANQGYDESLGRKTNFVGSKRFIIEPPYTERHARVALGGRRGRPRLLPDFWPKAKVYGGRGRSGVRGPDGLSAARGFGAAQSSGRLFGQPGVGLFHEARPLSAESGSLRPGR